VEAGGLLGAGEAGFTLEEAIQIATLNGARILGEDVDIGSIAVGKRADLVLVRGDSVADPSSIYEVVTVFKDGRGFDSARLRSVVEGTIGPS
jgi:imidazolonepropionase-like amidohydrolase